MRSADVLLCISSQHAYPHSMRRTGCLHCERYTSLADTLRSGEAHVTRFMLMLMLTVLFMFMLAGD